MPHGIYLGARYHNGPIMAGLATYLLDVIPSLENDHAPPPVSCCEVVPSVVELHGSEKVGCQSQTREMSTTAPGKTLHPSR